MDTIERVLAQNQLFQGLSSSEIQSIAKIVIPQVFKRGEQIFEEGEDCHGFYLIQQGKVKIFKISPLGKEQILHIFETGEHFAEVPAFDGLNFPASAIAMSPATLLLFPRTEFLNLLKKESDLTINMLSNFARHIRRFAHLVESLSLKEVPERLAAYLLNLREQKGNLDQFKIDIPKNQLAALLGTIPETLSRVFYKLSTDQLIKIQGSTIIVLDLQGLQNLARGQRKSS